MLGLNRHSFHTLDQCGDGNASSDLRCADRYPEMRRLRRFLAWERAEFVLCFLRCGAVVTRHAPWEWLTVYFATIRCEDHSSSQGCLKQVGATGSDERAGPISNPLRPHGRRQAKLVNQDRKQRRPRWSQQFSFNTTWLAGNARLGNDLQRRRSRYRELPVCTMECAESRRQPLRRSRSRSPACRQPYMYPGHPQWCRTPESSWKCTLSGDLP
jgi:hypothetical protein